MLISFHSRSKRLKISTLWQCIQLSEEFDCTYFSNSSGVVRKIKSDLAIFLGFLFFSYGFKIFTKIYGYKRRFLNNHQSLEYTTLCL